MNFLKTLREDEDLSDLLRDVCDVEILPDFQTPEDEGGHLAYNLPGKTFARAGSGSEYILLEDGSVGYWGSEGECGRLADSLREFFALIVNCPYWQDYLDEEKYQDRESLSAYAREVYEGHADDALSDFDLPEARRELAERLGIELEADAAEVLTRFYHCARREPRFMASYTEDDGSTHCGTGSLFDR